MKLLVLILGARVAPYPEIIKNSLATWGTLANENTVVYAYYGNHHKTEIVNGELLIGTNDLNIICYEYYEKLLVKVPDETTKKVYEEYMIKTYAPKEYEIDHWIPLALGGTNNIENLWPQPIIYPGYKEKDYVQLYLRDQVCDHGMNLTDARMKITGDWYSLYLKIRETD